MLKPKRFLRALRAERGQRPYSKATLSTAHTQLTVVLLEGSLGMGKRSLRRQDDGAPAGSTCPTWWALMGQSDNEKQPPRTHRVISHLGGASTTTTTTPHLPWTRVPGTPVALPCEPVRERC